MSRYPHLPLFTDAFIADTTHLSAEETGAYLMLLMIAWRDPECRLPDNDTKLARYARVTPESWRVMRGIVLGFWELSDGFWTQRRLLRERQRVSRRVEASRANGRRGGRPKALKDKEGENPPGSSQDNDRFPLGSHQETGGLRETNASISRSLSKTDSASAKTSIFESDAGERLIPFESMSVKSLLKASVLEQARSRFGVERLPFTPHALRQVASMCVDVGELALRYLEKTNGRRIRDPSAYIVRMAQDAVAKRDGVSVAEVQELHSPKVAVRAAAYERLTRTEPGSVDGPEAVAAALARAEAARAPKIAAK